MKKRLQVILLLPVYLLIQLAGNSQLPAPEYPVPGKPVPEFSLKNVHYYSQSEFEPKQIKGKWLVLDFWNKRCIACIRSFPKINELQAEFKEQIQFMLVGQNDRLYNEGIEHVFEVYRKKMGLDLPVAFDSVLSRQFKVAGMPHVVVVDPKGIVYAVTGGDEITKEKLKDLIEGKQPVFRNKAYESEKETVISEGRASPSDISREKNILYSSILSINSGEPMTGSWSIDEGVKEGKIDVSRANLFQLYNLAYFGEGSWGRRGLYFTHWQVPILETSDSSLFYYSYVPQKGFYNYSLKVPVEKATKGYLMEQMQEDLQHCFGYEVVIEKRAMPCWKLKAKAEAIDKLKSKTKKYSGDFGPAGVKGKSVTIESILGLIQHYSKNDELPFFDETGIEGTIDVSFEAVMTDLEDVRQALMKQGMILEKSVKEMTVLVIREPRR